MWPTQSRFCKEQAELHRQNEQEVMSNFNFSFPVPPGESRFSSFSWLSNIPVCVCGVYIMVSLSTHLSMDTKPASMSWLLQIILQWILGTYKCKSHWSPKPGDLELSLGSNYKHQGTRQVHKFLSRRYCPAGMRQREQRWLLPASKPPESVKWEAGPSGWCFKINKPLSQKVWALFSHCPCARPQEGDQVHAALQKLFLRSWAWWVLQMPVPLTFKGRCLGTHLPGASL